MISEIVATSLVSRKVSLLVDKTLLSYGKICVRKLILSSHLLVFPNESEGRKWISLRIGRVQQSLISANIFSVCPLRLEQNRTEQNRTEQNRRDQNRKEQNITEQNRTEQDRIEQNRIKQKSTIYLVEKNQIYRNSQVQTYQKS